IADPPALRADRAAAAPDGIAEPVADRGPQRAMQLARRARLGARHERHALHGRTPRRGETTRRRVDTAPDDVVGHGEFRWRTAARRRAHEVRPDGQRALRAGEARRAALVE